MLNQIIFGLIFLNTFTKYDVYIIIDDNSVDYSKQYNLQNKNIHFVQINDELCYKNGFVGASFLLGDGKQVAGWEKALYYFSTINNKYYNHIWFCEEDVFFYSEETLINIDTQNINGDLLSNTGGDNPKGQNTDWIWNRIKIKIPPPYYCNMMCAVRMSTALLLKIKNYASFYNTLFYLEALFSTICKSSGLIHNTLDELKTILYRKEYSLSDINKHNLFHPVKNIAIHEMYRKHLNN